MQESDNELEAELRRLAADKEPVPAELVQAALDAFGWRDIDAELAELVYDSLADADEASLVRGSPGQRLVSFAVGGMTIDLEVTSAPDEPAKVRHVTLVPGKGAVIRVARTAPAPGLHGSREQVTTDRVSSPSDVRSG